MFREGLHDVLTDRGEVLVRANRDDEVELVVEPEFRAARLESDLPCYGKLSMVFNKDYYGILRTMVQLNFEIDEDTATNAKVVKAAADLTWPEFVERGTECIADDLGIELPEER